MLPVSIKDSVFFPHGGATYRLAVPTYLQRAAFRREMREAGAAYPGDGEIYRALRDDLRDVAPVNLDALLAVVDQAEEAGGENDRAALDRLGDVARLARAIGGRFASMEGERAYWFDVAPYMACRHFLLGWEGRPDPCERANGRTADTALERLGEAGVHAVGYHILSLMRVDADAAGNSESPSPSPSSPEPSSPDSRSLPQPAAAGTSAEPSTPTTPPAG